MNISHVKRLATNLLWRDVKGDCSEVNHVNLVDTRQDKEQTRTFSLVGGHLSQSENHSSLILLDNLEGRGISYSLHQVPASQDMLVYLD